MNTRCPQCNTVYDVDPDALRATHGMARCHVCDTVFDALAENTDNFSPVQSDAPKPTREPKPDQEPDLNLNLDIETPAPEGFVDPERDLALEIEDVAETQLPFDLPEDLPDLEPSSETGLDMHGPPQPSRRGSSAWWQILLLMLLILLLAGQLAWLNRVALLQLPQAQPLCAWIDCGFLERRDPAAFEVVERQLQTDPGIPEALRLQLRFRNAADFQQAMPRLRLSLFDNSGSLLARRTLQPDEYLFPVPANDRVAGAQEVFTIELLFADPDKLASGFEIDFL